MCVYSDIVVSSKDFALDRTMQTHPNLRIEFEQTVPMGTDAMPYLWITNAGDASVGETVRSEPGIEHVELIDRVQDDRLVRIRWGSHDSGVIRALLDTNATCLSCIGAEDAWYLTLRFPSSSDLAACYQQCTDADLRLDVRSIRTGGRAGKRNLASTLSDPQREAITTGLECGYFAVPRRITLQELADRLDISDTAASQRLRRGLEELLADALSDADHRTDTPTLPTAIR